MNKAIILLSGGLDSVVSLACEINHYSDILALTFDYSQKSAYEEIKASQEISKLYGIKHKVIKLDWLGEISNSSLNTNNVIPDLEENQLDNILITQKTSNSVWVPNRNALFINIAGCFAEACGCNTIIIGANKEEGETFVDNSPQFVKTINESLKFSTNVEVNVIAPLLDLNKREIVKKGIELNIPFKFLYSCYNGNGRHCGKCESCQRLKRALKELGQQDIVNSLFG